MNIHLGYAVPSGDVVEIPLRHMAVCGQTQEAGKTTALEALITRAGVRAVTFITKRGEGSFTSARRIDPYFREQADWQFVASILEASRGEKLKFERAWIIRASKGAHTLADVQRNVRKAMETAKGLAGDVYLTLDAYLDVVVPAIARVAWASRVELAAGVNAMDLTGLTTEMQHLVIKSTLDWVLDREERTVVVIPEAWKFIPQGRGTPVKLSAAAFIRQGAGLKNYLWLDSQDLGGIEKEILRSVPVWILGVQREANEIKRTLENIPSGIAKPSKADIATLELGQFFACWGKHAIRTYVQPAWMNDAQAEQVATGVLPLHIAVKLSPLASMRRAFDRTFGPLKEEHVTKDEAAQLADENRVLKARNEQLMKELQELSARLRTLEKGHHDRKGTAATGRVHEVRESEAGQHRAEHSNDEGTASVRSRSVESSAPSNGRVDEALYQALRARILEDAEKDPTLLKVLVSRPELMVAVTRHTVNADGSSALGRTAQLIAEGFLDVPKKAYAVWNESKRRGFAGAAARMDEACKKLTEMGFLTKEGDGYRAVAGMKVNIVDA